MSSRVGRAEPSIEGSGVRHVLLMSRGLALPLACSAGLMAFALAGVIGRNPRLLWSFLAVGAALLAWTAALFFVVRSTGRPLAVDIALRKQHWVQACAHTAIFLYWGWHWPQVYHSAHLIAAQLLFAYAFDMLLSWSRRDTYALGFGPFPIVFSTNLFLWFKEDWFIFQFLMVGLGFAGKELIRWKRDGRPCHIFNPSSFALSVVSLALIASGLSHITWGQEIANTQAYPPHMYLWLFLVALPGQFFFGVTSMTMSAVVTVYLFGLAFFAVTGTYFFYDSYIPIAVFLGMHLLFTDPSTSPRTELGRLIFGVLYGLSVVALNQLLTNLGLPQFYDKLLQVPFLNLSVRFIDSAVRSKALGRFDPAAIGALLTGRQRNVAYMAIWSSTFAVMSAVGGVGDGHRGQWVPFWQQACGAGRSRACAFLFRLEAIYCDGGSGWACNELVAGPSGAWLHPALAHAALARGCQRGFGPACENASRLAAGQPLQSAPPALADYPMILKGSKAVIADRRPPFLYALACRQGFSDACGRSDAVGGK